MVGPVEALEEVRHIGGINPNARITYTQHGLSFDPFHRDRHAAPVLFTAGGILDRVIEQDQRDAAQAFLVAMHAHRLNMADLQLERRSLHSEPAAQLAHQMEYLVIKLDGRLLSY